MRRILAGSIALLLSATAVSGCKGIWNPGPNSYTLAKVSRHVEAYNMQEKCDALLERAKKLALKKGDEESYKRFCDRTWCPDDRTRVQEHISELKDYLGAK